jgi:hypothetical protein
MYEVDYPDGHKDGPAANAIAETGCANDVRATDSFVQGDRGSPNEQKRMCTNRNRCTTWNQR